MTPAVSVAVATHNYGRYLADALASVRRQTFADWECVVVDDGSRDDTAAVVRPFLADPRFRYVPSDNLGQARAKNLALRLSRAPLVAFLDGDDAWLPAKLERQVRLLDACPEVGVAFTRRFLVAPDGGLLPSVHATPHRGDVYAAVLLDNFVCFSSAVARRDLLERVGAFDPRLDLAIDYDLWLRCARHARFDFIDEPLVKYRTGHGNLSRRITERITIVLSTMRRSLTRRGNEESVAANVLREAWGSTCRTMGFVLRDAAPCRAAGWYLRAACHDRRWGATLRAVLRSFGRWTLIRGGRRDV
jgi:glycosyltransferase involved in cell wall biosynthesis